MTATEYDLFVQHESVWPATRCEDQYNADGNVYVTGESQGDNGDLDYATIAYDSDGNQLWVARYDGPANGDDSAVAVALDSSGDVYVTGSSLDASGYMD